jgi:carbon-monoxide dehydrogenase medium subunit
VFRQADMEQALASDFSAGSIDGVTVDDSNLMSDIHASAAYRANLVKVMAKRAVGAAG